MFGEFVDTNVAAVNGHGVRVRGEGNDTGAVLEFDVADLDFLGEGSRAPLGIEGRYFDEFFAVTQDRARVAHHTGDCINLVRVFERAGRGFGVKAVIAVRNV